MVSRGPPLGQRPRTGPAFHPARDRLKASKGPGVDPARMHTAPVASWLRVFTEPPARFLGLLSPPPPHFLAGPCGPSRKLVPGDKPEDNEEGAAGPEALQAKTTSASRSLTPTRDQPAGWDAQRPTGGAGSGPAFLPLTPSGQTQFPPESDRGPGRGMSLLLPGPPRDLPQVLHLRGHFAKGRGVVNQ